MADFESVTTKNRSYKPEEDTLSSRLDLMKKYQDLIDNPEYSEKAPPESRASLQAAIDAAKSTYDKEKNAAEWGEVGQMLARAGTQFAAASQGLRTGRNMAGLDFGPGIDYGKKKQTAFEEYRDAIRNQEGLARAGRTDVQDANAVKRAEFGKRERAIREEMDAKAQEERNRRMEESETKRSTREDKREAGRQAKEDARQSAAEKKAEIAELNLQEKEAKKQLKAAETLKNQIEQEGDISGKSSAKLQEKYGALAGQADVDLDLLKGRLEGEEGTDPGAIYGRNANPEKQKKILGEKSAEIRGLLAKIQARKRELGLIKDGSSSTAPAADAEVTVKGPSGETAVMLKSVYESKYKNKKGYSLVK